MHTAIPQYDPGIIPTEVAARKQREGELFGTTAKTKKSPESLDTTGGYTSDQEGLANNYAIEPEMYISQPGERKENAERAAKRISKLEALAEDGTGRLTMEGDTRHQGQGRI